MINELNNIMDICMRHINYLTKNIICRYNKCIIFIFIFNSYNVKTKKTQISLDKDCEKKFRLFYTPYSWITYEYVWI